MLDVSGIERILREEPGRLQAWLDGFTEDVLTDIVLSFGQSPSAPGEPPGVDTDTLRGSMTWEPRGHLENEIHDGVEYGVYLEDGTERIAPRPFMRPAFDRAQGRMERDAQENLKLE